MTDFCLQVVDSFYPNPEALRSQALATPIDIKGGNPGLSSANVDVSRHMSRIGKILKIRPDYKHLKFTALFRMTRGSDEVRDTDIHVDGPCYAGVCYLNPPEQCSGGTTFYRHKKTGLERWPTRKETLSLIQAGKLPASVKREKDEIVFWEEQGHDRTLWEPTIHVPMKFNRALFYDGRQFHTMSSWTEFGNSPSLARLTMVYFFHET